MKKIIFSTMVLLMTACSPIPKLERGTVVKVDDISTGMSDSRGFIFSNEEWWKIYKDPILNHLVAYALAENEDLKTARLNMVKSDEAVELAESSHGIEINGVGDLKREKLGKNGTTPPPFGGKIITIGTLGLQGDYNIDIFNKLHSLTEEQKYKSEAVKLNTKWIELNITNRVAKLYFYWNYLQQEKDTLEKQREILEKIVILNRENLNIGNGIESSVWEAENELRSMDSLIKENQLNIQLTINNLNILSGNKHQKEIEELLNGKNSMADLILGQKLPLPSTVSSDIVVNRPDVEYYLMLIKGQEKHLAAAKADFYPQFSITGQWGFEGITMGKILRRDSLMGFIGPSLYLPIFHSGEIRANYKIAGTDLNIFIEEYNNAILNAYNNINNELYKTKTFLETLKNSDTSLVLEKRILEQNRKRLEIGTISQMEYLIAEYNWNNHKLSNQQENFNFTTQQLTLLNALGGSYSNGGK